jgi:hypothetical protein
MRQNAHTKNRTETRTLLAATLTCYLAGFACVLAFGYSLASLAAPGFADNVRVTIEREARQ